MRKSDRHAIIKEIIESKEISTQEELLLALKAQGIEATQATISRDIRELKIVKKATMHGQVKFELFEEAVQSNEELNDQELFTQIYDSVIRIDTAQFLTVIHTAANNAQILSAALDDYPMKEKVATIAGFDTVVVISKSNEDAKMISEFIALHMNQ